MTPLSWLELSDQLASDGREGASLAQNSRGRCCQTLSRAKALLKWPLQQSFAWPASVIKATFPIHSELAPSLFPEASLRAEARAR